MIQNSRIVISTVCYANLSVIGLRLKEGVLAWGFRC